VVEGNSPYNPAHQASSIAASSSGYLLDAPVFINSPEMVLEH